MGTFTADQLKYSQESIEQRIYSLAKENKLTINGISPITDGIGDFKAYLASSPKVAWILKEPYDEVKGGMVGKGGWSIPRDCFMKEGGSWSVRSWQRVIYVMYGLRNHLKYSQMDYIRDNWEMGTVLREIAWINLSKMPASTSSSNLAVKKAYESYWKDIVKEQIELYDPKVIVFGNTLDLYRNSYGAVISKSIEQVYRERRCFIDVYEQSGRILLHAYHPGIRCIHGIRGLEEHYVDSLIETIEKYG